MAIVFWPLAVTVLYLETRHFVWNGLWTVRFSLCLAFVGKQTFLTCQYRMRFDSGHLTKTGFVLNPYLTKIDALYFGFMLSALCQFFLTIFALSQIPAADHLILDPQHTYEVYRIFLLFSSHLT